MSQKKLHRVVVSNVDAKVKVGQLKLQNDNRSDKNAQYFLKSPLSNFAIDDWLSKSTYWVQFFKKLIEEFHTIISSHLQLLVDVPTFFKYIQTWKFAIFNSIFCREFQREKIKKKKHNPWDEQPNIDLAMKRVLYK